MDVWTAPHDFTIVAQNGAKRVATLNIGGSGTTSVCFVVGN